MPHLAVGVQGDSGGQQQQRCPAGKARCQAHGRAAEQEVAPARRSAVPPCRTVFTLLPTRTWNRTTKIVLVSKNSETLHRGACV